MDTSIIVAIISAMGTIIAALVAALIGVKVAASRNNEQLEARTDVAEARAEAVAKIGKRLSTAEPEERPFLEDNLSRLGEMGALTTSRLKQAEITVYPGEHNLLFVVQKDNPRPAFNVLTKLTNSGQQVGIVDGLEAVLTDPEGVSFRFMWHLFYGVQRGGLRHTLSSYIHPIAINPGSSILLGIQFIGPDLGIAQLYSWPTGRYKVEITGWVNRIHDRRPTNLNSKFYIEISSMDIARLKGWIGWDDAAWKQFGDPDNAAGHPVPIITG